MAAGLPLPKVIATHGFFTIDGQKMSKSLGNVIDPFELIERYDPEVIRYFMLRELQSSDDGDFSYKNLETRYVTDLANGLGNLVQRTAVLVETKLGKKVVYNSNLASAEASLQQVLDDSDYHRAFEAFKLHDALASVWAKIGQANAYLNDRQPWKQEGDEQYKTLIVTTAMIMHIAWLLEPFMPSTAQKVARVFGLDLTSSLTDGDDIKVQKGELLFPRK